MVQRVERGLIPQLERRGVVLLPAIQTLGKLCEVEDALEYRAGGEGRKVVQNSASFFLVTIFA